VTTRAGRTAVLAAALTILCVALVACSAAAVPNPIVNNASSDNSFVTPNPAQFTATPTFPTFTIGAWPSEYSPNENDTITIYAICRVQDPTMQAPSTPPPVPVTVTAQLSGPISATISGQTGTDGIAAIQYVLNDPFAGQPVLVTVTASYKGQTYVATTFFTASVTSPPTPTATTPGSKPTATPTP
jgi:hypothetical protein